MNDQTPDAGFTADFQELYSHGMDRALGIQKASLAAVVRLNANAIDHYMNAFWFSPVLGNLCDAAAQAFASCMELQMSLLTLMASHVSDTVESISGMQAQFTTDVLERSMDIAIKERFTAPSSTVASISGSQTKTTEEVMERNVEIAIGSRAGG